MTNEVIIRCQKTPEVGIGPTAYTHVGLYTPNTPLEPIKIWGPGQDLGGGLCPPGPSLKPPLDGALQPLLSFFSMDYCGIVVDYRSTPARTECHCAACLGPIAIRHGLAITGQRHFCALNISLAPYLLSDPVQDCAADVHRIHWPVSGVGPTPKTSWHPSRSPAATQSTATTICRQIRDCMRCSTLLLC